MSNPTLAAAQRMLDSVCETASELRNQLDTAEQEETLTTLQAARLLVALDGIHDALTAELDRLEPLIEDLPMVATSEGGI